MFTTTRKFRAVHIQGSGQTLSVNLGVWKCSGLPRKKANAGYGSIDHLAVHGKLRFNRRITEFTVGGGRVRGGAFRGYGTSCLDEFVDFEPDLKGLGCWARVETVGKRHQEMEVKVADVAVPQLHNNLRPIIPRGEDVTDLEKTRLEILP